MGSTERSEQGVIVARIQTAVAYRIRDGRLELLDESGTVTARLDSRGGGVAQATALASAAPTAAATLPPEAPVGVLWHAIDYVHSPDKRGPDPTLQLWPNGWAAYDAGCGFVPDDGAIGVYEGAYTVAGSTISIGPLLPRYMPCVGSRDRTLESALLAAIQTAVAYRISDGKLELLDKSGAIVARFETR